MAALASLMPEDRDELIAELAATRTARGRYAANLARLQRDGARRFQIGKLRAQIAACDRHIDRMERLLDEVAA